MNLSVKDAARLLSVSEKTVYRWAQKEEIPFLRVNDQYRFSRAELLEWATAKRVRVSPEIFEEADGEPPLLADALEAGGIFYRVAGNDVTSVLQEVVAILRLPDEVDREHLHEVLLARERLGSTAVGEGVAIPHARSPVILHLARPTVTLCFLEHPVEFHALDDRPVQVLFTVVSPTLRAHLHLLSRLAFCLRDPQFKGLLAEEAGREAILEGIRKVEASLAGPGTGRGA